jgi:hypothetical protein
MTVKNQAFYVVYYEDRFEIMQDMKFRSEAAAEQFCQDNFIEPIEIVLEEDQPRERHYVESCEELVQALWKFTSSSAETYRSFFQLNDLSKSDPIRIEEMRGELRLFDDLKAEMEKALTAISNTHRISSSADLEFYTDTDTLDGEESYSPFDRLEDKE